MSKAATRGEELQHTLENAGAQIMASYPSHIATDALPEKFRSFLSSLDFTTFNIISAVRVTAQP